MNSGDIVIHRYDEDRGLACYGIVLELRLRRSGWTECLVLWGSESNPIGWHDKVKLRKID
jgi:hypothetical protein